MSRTITTEEFLATWNRFKSPVAVADALGIHVRKVYARRAALVQHGHVLDTADVYGRKTRYTLDDAPRQKFERRRALEVKNGTVIVFSDPHWYPDASPLALQTLIKLIKELKPQAVVCGGDALDGTQIGRHEVVRGWHAPPALSEQLECMTESMTEIRKACPKGSTTMMTLGNHDARLSRYLAVNAPHAENLPGTRIEDYIPSWPLSWTVQINGDTIIRHRNVGGMLHLQAPRTGMNFIHGHLHKMNVYATPQYQRFLFSVDAGSLSDPASDAFDYSEDGVPHVQGFAVLSFSNGELMWPELCYIRGQKAYFRGQQV